MRPGSRTVVILSLVFFFTLLWPFWNVDQTPVRTSFLRNVAFAVAEVYGTTAEPYEEEFFDEEMVEIAPDPLERLNRAFFVFNDRLYFWVLKPVGTVYGTFFPPGVRTGISNGFSNIKAPVRVVSTTLQRKFRGTGVEIARFVINSSLGIGGYFDIARTHFGLQPYDEDLGQTLGFYGMRPVMYLHLPFMGPSSVRDAIGDVGDGFLNPIYYLSPNAAVSTGIKAGEETNDVSLRIGDYEDFKAAALDPYIALRDAYLQYRESKVRQ